MSNALIRAAFEQKLATWAAAQSPAIPVIYENDPTPIPAGRYCACYLLPLPTESDFMERTDRQFSGVFQVNLFTSSATGSVGPGEAETLVASIDTAFGMRLTNGAVTVHLTRPMSARPSFPDADRFLTPIDCAYVAAVAP